MIIFSFVILILCIFFMGSAVFSFVNACSCRWERGESFIFGRSRCDFCGKSILPYDLIPVISFIVLKGRCRFCGCRLGIRYIAVEAFGGALALYCVYHYLGMGIFDVIFRSGLAFLFCGLLMLVFLTDIDVMRIPDGAVMAIMALGVLSLFIFKEISFIDRVIGFFSASLPMLLLSLVINGAFGGGDIKLMAATGFFLGLRLNLTALFLAVMFGGGYAVWLLTVKRAERKAMFAFGPFLAAGCVMALFWGNGLLEWYTNLFL